MFYFLLDTQLIEPALGRASTALRNDIDFNVRYL
jgi:hypothetical protein